MTTQRPAKQVFFFTALQQTLKHKGDKKLLYIDECVCLKTHAHSDTHTHAHTAGCESAVLGGYKKQGFLGFWGSQS